MCGGLLFCSWVAPNSPDGQMAITLPIRGPRKSCQFWFGAIRPINCWQLRCPQGIERVVERTDAVNYIVPIFIIKWVIHPRLSESFDTFRTRENGRHLADAIFKCIFLNENVWMPNKISLKFVPQGPINNIQALVGAKPLSGPMMVRLPTHICITRPQWVNTSF